MNQTYIYLLTDGKYYYVGKTSNLNKRLNSHTANAFNKKNPNYFSRKNKWVRSYNSVNNARQHINLEVLDTVPNEEWIEKEIQWIEYYRLTYGCEIVLNTTDGGEGLNEGEGHPNSLLSDEEILEAAKLYKETPITLKELGQKYGVSKSCFSTIFKGQRRAYLDLDIHTRYTNTEMVIKLYEDGWTIENIANLFNVGGKAIRVHLRQEGFTKPWRNR